MSLEKSLLEIYKKRFRSRIDNTDYELVDSFFSKFYKSASKESIEAAKNNPYEIEFAIEKQILKIKEIGIDIPYLSQYTQKLNANSIKYGDMSIILCDETLQYSLLAFYFTIFSLAFDNSPENFSRCFKSCVTILDLQGNKHTIGTHSIDDIFVMCNLPERTINLIMDTYWTNWTFIFAHELYHLTTNIATTNFQEELDADTYAYNTLIELIGLQTLDRLPDNIQVFYDYLYLSPIMLMEFFGLIDYYNDLFNRKFESSDYPSPELRKENIFNLFDESLPENFNTDEGNDLLNIFLNQIDLIKDQLRIKVQNGKLDFLRDI